MFHWNVRHGWLNTDFSCGSKSVCCRDETVRQCLYNKYNERQMPQRHEEFQQVYVIFKNISDSFKTSVIYSNNAGMDHLSHFNICLTAAHRGKLIEWQQTTYCSQTACMVVTTQDFLVSSCNMSLCSCRKSTTGRTIPVTYAEAFDGTYNRRLLLLVCCKNMHMSF